MKIQSTVKTEVCVKLVEDAVKILQEVICQPSGVVWFPGKGEIP
jgi:hypothetical protein